ncbi:COX15/CtaA family protein [soil metagenome]
MGVSLARFVRQLGWASLVANIGIVVTGGAVRLTGSGLGCPTWPRCTDESFRPHGELDLHQAIEFGNRMLTFVLTAVAIATFVAAVQAGLPHLRRLALVLALGIPAQAVIGGITVLTGLNPWIVGVHLLVSMAMVAVSVLFLWRIDHPDAVWRRGGPVPALAWSLFGSAWVVLFLGTVVTGAGPHAGDADTPRSGLDTLEVSQLHADAVFLFVGLTIGAAFAVWITRGAGTALRAALLLLAVEAGQSTIGFVQYFTDLPEILVGFHMLGAGLISAAVTRVVLEIVLCDTPGDRSEPVGDTRTPTHAG